MSFIRDMNSDSGEYAAAVDQVLVHCKDSKWSIREAGELLYAKLHSPSEPPGDPAALAEEGFNEFIASLENEAGIKVEFVVAVHVYSLHKQYLRWVQEASMLYSMVADATMALESYKKTFPVVEPFSARDMIDCLVRSYYKKTEAMAILVAQEILLMGKTVDPEYPSDSEYLSALSREESEEGEEDGGEEGQKDDEFGDAAASEFSFQSDNESAILDATEARIELGVDDEENATDGKRDELAEELEGLVVDAADLADGLEELKKIEKSIVASGGSMAVPPPIKEEPKEECSCPKCAGTAALQCPDSRGKRKAQCEECSYRFKVVRVV